MASGKVEWIMSIIDRASGPASTIERKIGLVEKRIQALDKASKAASDPATRDRMAYQKLGLELQRDQLHMRALKEESGAWIQKLHSGLAVVGMIGGALKSVASITAQAGGAAAKFTAGFALRGAKAGAYRESNVAALSTLLGSQGRAEAAFDQGQKFAAETPFKIADVMRWQKNLLVGGFSQEDSMIVLKGLGDMAAMNDFNPEIVDRAALALKQIKAKGRLMGQEMLQLAEAGVSQGAVYAQLEKLTGKDNAGVRKLQEKGGISADMGIYAVMAALKGSTSGGVLGGAMEKFGKGTLTGLMSTLMDKPEEFLMKLGTSKGFATLKEAVTQTIAVLDTQSETGKRISEELDRTFTAIIEDTFGQFTGPDGPAKISELFEDMRVGFGKLIETGRITIALVEGIGAGFISGLDPVGKVFGEGPLGPEKLAKVAEAGEKFGAALGKIADIIGTLFGSMTDRKTALGANVMGRLDDISEYGLLFGNIKATLQQPFRYLQGMSAGTATDSEKAYAAMGASPSDFKPTQPGVDLGRAMARNLGVQVNAPVVINGGGPMTPEQARAVGNEAGARVSDGVTHALTGAAASQGAI